MHKNKLIFVTLTVILAVTTVFVTSKLILSTNEDAVTPLPGGANVAMGLPGIISQNSDKTFDAASALLWDQDTKTIAFEENGFERRPIASITKLMTAMVALDHGIDWNKTVTLLPEDDAIGGKLIVHPGESVTMRDLFVASLLGSANNATKAYVRELGIPKEEFIRRMNRKAIELGLDQTVFVGVTGLDDDNVSTAYEVAQFAAVAFNDYPDISKTTSLPSYSMIFGGTGREHSINNTNKLVAKGEIDVSGSKTGFLYEAQYCLVIQGQDKYRDRISVILGSPSGTQQFIDAQRLLELPVP